MALKIIGTVGELSLSYEELISLKTEITESGNRLYELYIYFIGSCKVFYCKFITEESHVSTKSEDAIECNMVKHLVGEKKISSKVCLWKILHLPFDLSEVVQSGKCLWAISSDSYVDIKPYFQNVLKFNEVNSKEDNLMDVDYNDEFVMDNFECCIKIPEVEKYAIHKESFTLKCNLMDNSVIFCHKNLELKSWDLELLVPVYNTDSLKLLKFKSVPIFKIPLHFDEEFSSAAAIQDATEIPIKPVITLINIDNSSSEESQLSTKKFLYQLFSFDSSSSSNCIFLFGYQSGNVLWSACSWSFYKQKFETITELQILCDIKQPIAGIHFSEKLGEIKDICSLLIVGILGKIVVITTENVFSNSHAYEGQALKYWSVTLYLHSPVQHHVILNDCILHASEKGHLWIAVFSEERKTSKGLTENNLKITSKAVDLHGIMQMTIINKQAGLILVVTAVGNLYLTQYIKSVNTYNTSASLPSLMNEGLHQSVVMQNLLAIKYQQSKFFSALCTFAALKFKSVPRAKLSCSITEIDVEPKKFFLEINLKCFEKLNLDPDFWLVAVSLCSYFQDNHTIISKTSPLFSGKSILAIEVLNSQLCPSSINEFPLFVEVGLILNLPSDWRTLDCFKLSTKMLPLYLRMQTIIVHELYLLKSIQKPLANYSDSRHSYKLLNNVLTKIQGLVMNKPISNILRPNFVLADTPQQFTFILSISAVQDIAKNSLKGCDLIHYVNQLLLEKSNIKDFNEDTHLTCKGNPLSFSVALHGDIIQVTVTTKCADVLLGSRIAIIDTLLKHQNLSVIPASKFISISASLHRKCEELSQIITSIYGNDVEPAQFTMKILKLYQKLRKELSEKLPLQ